MKKGLLAYILKDSLGDCSNDGISSKAQRVIIVGDNIPKIFETDEKTPAIKIVKRNLSNGEYIHAEPLENPRGNGWMAGGAFIYSCDSRFRELVNAYPVSLHDRQEF